MFRYIGSEVIAATPCDADRNRASRSQSVNNAGRARGGEIGRAGQQRVVDDRRPAEIDPANASGP